MQDFIELAEQHARPLREPKNLAPLIDRIKDCRLVMLGESSHGTHEFYEWRRMISEWLIVKHGFTFIAVEGDWPDCRWIDRSISGENPESARTTLERFRRWPTWMWANTEVIRLVEWLKSHNSRLPLAKRVSFHGMDVYSLFDSIDEVVRQLEKINPFLARRARVRYSCFDPHDRDEKSYVRSLFQLPEGCEDQVVQALRDMIELKLSRDSANPKPLLDIEQNARVIRNAESYYRSMVRANDHSWNVRDQHMMETLETLLRHHGPGSRGIVWAHNTHIGDYRATDMAREGLINVGGLARERLGEDQVALVGFGTHDGTVIASRAWDGPIESLEVPAARTGSAESAFHRVAQRLECQAFFTLMTPELRQSPLNDERGHRAIGVVYQPHYESRGNYVPTRLAERYDAFIHIDRTQALSPLIQGFEGHDLPETWPAGL